MAKKRILYLGLNPAAFQERGDITHFPVIQIVPRPLSDPSIQQALSLFSFYTHVIITSKSSVPILANYLLLTGFSLKHWQEKETIAVGKSTEKALKKFSISSSIVAQQETAEGIIQELSACNFESPFFFWPHSSLSRPLISHYLEEQKWKWQECPLYDTRPFTPSFKPNLAQFDEVLFTSPSTVDAFLKLYPSIPSHLLLTSIGPITEAYLIKSNLIK